MESISPQLTKRFKEVFLNGKLVAFTNYKDQLANIGWQQATQKVASLNTIALLTFHINYYLDGVLNVLNGGNLEIRDKYSFDAPELTSEQDWESLVNDLLSNAEEFAQHIEAMSDEQLNSVFVNEKYGSYASNINLMIEHAYYHLGQIVLVRKLIKEKN